MATRMQQRKGTAAQWISTNGGDGPVLNAGEIGFESDTNKFKIGDGVNHWVDLTYFTDADSALAAVTDLIGGAPDLLNTLNELAAAVNDDPAFFTTVATNLSNHEADTMGIHGITDTAALATKTYADTAVSTHNSDTTNVHGIENTNDLATRTYADTAVSTHNSDTTSVHGIADTSLLAIASTVATDISSAVTTHNNDTTNVHGIADTSVLATQSDLTNAISTHNSVTTNVHGIGDTSLLAIASTVATDISSAVSSHNSTTTNIHGIADTSVLATTSTVATAKSEAEQTAAGYVTAHNDDTTNVHGIADTSLLATQSYADTAEADAITAAGTAADTKISTAVAALTKSSVGLGNVDNTSDANKPVSSATQTALDLKLALAGGTMTGAITLHADPSSSLHAATKQYVDNTASGIVAKPQVLGATTANIDATYNNGTAGVGATLTHNTNGAFPSEAGGASGWAVGKGILVKNQTNKEENGRYYVSDMGSPSTPYVLTRCSYCDEANEIPGAYIFVQDGTFAGTGWIQVVADPATFTVGTDDIDVFQFSGSGTITAGTNISVSGNEVSVVATPSLSGVAFTDGTQTKEGVPSRTPIVQKTASYALSTLTHRDSLIEVSSTDATTITIPEDSTVNYPIGTTLDILQTNTGQVTIAPVSGSVTVNATPGLKLRTRWSSCTLLKRAANTWVVFGDLTA